MADSSFEIVQLKKTTEEIARLKHAYFALQQKFQLVSDELAKAHLSLLQKTAELAQTTETLGSILRHIAHGVIFVRVGGNVALFNEAAERLLGRSLKSAQSVWSVLDDDQFGFSLREALAFGLSYRLIYKTIQSREYEISAAFLSEGSPPSRGILILFKDISDLQQLQRLATQADRMKELGELTAAIAHEIRNPLGGIRGYASLLYRDLSITPHLQDMAGSIVEGTKSLEHLVTQILHYARPVQIHLQSMELGAFLKGLGKFIRVDPTLPSTVKLEIHLPQEPLLVPIDPDALKRCLLNLVYNAIQAMPKGGVVTLALMRQEKTCQLSISDTGIGIDPVHVDKLFSPYFTTKRTGTGLGLVEAKKIAEAHSGRLEVRWLQGSGTTFILTIPLQRPS